MSKGPGSTKGIIIIFSILILVGLSASAGPTNREKRLAGKKAQSIVRTIVKPYMTDFEKIILLHEYVTDRVRYGKLKGKTSAYTALLFNQSDCVGFARSLHLLYQKAGLDSFVVVRRKGHLWVKVKVHGNYYNIDPTWCAVASRWPQYSWFLLSDRQNVDAAKGATHNLDSGEVYLPAAHKFIFKKSDYIHKRLLKSRSKLRIMGTINLPEGMTAPKGGIIGSVNGNRFKISEGKRSAFFIALIKRKNNKSPFLKYRIKTDGSGSLTKSGYYGRGQTVFRKEIAYRFNTSSLDQTGIRFNIFKQKHYISGKVSLPGNNKAPERGVYISMELTCYRGKRRVRYYDRIYIPGGKNSTQFHIDIPEKDKDKSFYLYYYSSTLAKNGYEKVGYYGKGNTVAEFANKSYLKLDNNLLNNINLVIIGK